MEVLLNELSLNGQFNSEDDFFDNVDEILSIIKLIEVLNFTITKENSFYKLQVTETLTFNGFLKLRTDRAKKMKIFFMKLAHKPPFWNLTQIHNCETNSYTYLDDDICASSLAESYERDRCVLSFLHPTFSSSNLQVYKNGVLKNIDNIFEKSTFLEVLFSRDEINPALYCECKYKDTNLNFSKYEEEYGFSSLNTPEQINAFLDAFTEFSKMSWTDITNSDGLEYKKYNKPKKKKVKGWFREGTYKSTDIYKFRVTQEYRCFGYRDGDVFYVLRFEIDHSISDHG